MEKLLPQIRVMALAELKPAPYNPRRMDHAAMAGLTKSMERFGNVQPIVWNRRSGFVVGGHQRLKVLKRQGALQTAVVVVDIGETDEKALNVALNSPGIAGEFTDRLEALLEQIRTDDAALFRDLQFDALLAQAKDPAVLVDPDQIPDLPKKPVTRPGDTWALGRHRLHCGDCRNSDSLVRLLGRAKLNLALTSPPYAQQRKYDQASAFRPIAPDAYVQWFESVAAGVRAHLAANGSFCINIKEHVEGGQRSLYVKDLTITFVRKWGWRFVDEFIWTHGGTPRTPAGRLKNGFEPIIHFALGTCKWRPEHVRHETEDMPRWGGIHPSQNDGMRMKGRQRISSSSAQGTSYKTNGNPPVLAPGNALAYPSNVISCGKNREALGHGAVFPVGLPSFFIQLLTDTSDRVFDPFAGAGTTLIACEQLDRTGYGCEISPAYCDVIVERWQNFTGKKARSGTP
jgi:DNA modification methylase